MRDELQTARRNFPRAEYQLVKDSFPETLHHLSQARLTEHIERCQKLIQSYRVRLTDKESLEHVWKKPTRLSSKRLMTYRMNELNACLRKFRSQLRRSKSKKAAAASSKTSKRAATASATPARKTSARKTTTPRKSATAKKASSSVELRSVRKKASSSKTPKKARASAKSTSKTVRASGVKKRPSMSNGKARREATIDEMTFAPKIEEQLSRAMSQPKMRLPRKSLKKGGQALRGRQSSEMLPTNSINPAFRRR